MPTGLAVAFDQLDKKSKYIAKLKKQNAALLAVLKEVFAAYDALSHEKDLSKLAEPMFRLTKALISAQQAIADAEGEPR